MPMVTILISLQECIYQDKKVKNIRPSLDLIAAFYNWNIDRIAKISEIIKKYK